MVKKLKIIPNWIKLDNAATIYPSTLTRKYASMFRVSVTLKEQVDELILNKALKIILKRFPTFNYKLNQGLFWHYFKHINSVPIIEEDVNNPMIRINFKENKGFMFRVRYYDKSISFECFHALTDGTGAITFLLSLVAEYLKIKNKISIEYSDKILNPKKSPKKEEIMDSFQKYARKTTFLEQEKTAYHYKGTLIDSHLLNIITGEILVDDIKKISKRYDCTITQFFVSVILSSLQDIQEKERRKNNKPLKVLVPINLRNFYKSNTMRNFSSYVNIGIETKYGHYNFDEIIKIVKNSMGLMITEKKLNAKISSNVKLARNYFIRLIPMFLKKYILSFSEYLMGDRYCSTTFSNLGNIDLPNSMSKYIKNINFIIGRSRNNPGTISCVSCNDKLYISFSRRIKETELEKLFFTKLVEMGIPVLIESNNRR
ncbi:MAG: hypothetical protein IJD92_04575 [Bacilli bacterium]|nr:hypothetical protein [Bacilli bacterium]